MLSDLRYRLRALFLRKRLEAELDEELRFHVTRETEKYRQAGMSEDEARRSAWMAFGGHEQIKEDVREAHGASGLEQFWQDLRYAARLIGKDPVFAAIAVVTLALGIGASSAAFSLVDVVLLKPLPYANAGRAVLLWGEAPIGSYYGNTDMPRAAVQLAGADANGVSQFRGIPEENVQCNGRRTAGASGRHGSVGWILSGAG